MQRFEIGQSSFNGYLALPDSGKGIAILLLHAWWGLNPFIIQTCDQLAQAGFVIFAPDYYSGMLANTIDEAKACKQKIDRNAVNKLVAMAADFLLGQPYTTGEKMGVIGYSLGCSFAIEAARSKPKSCRAIVFYYGTGGGNFDKTHSSFMGHFAANDAWGAHPKKVKALAERIRSKGQGAIFYTYEGTEHWFAETDRPEYHPQAAALAWARTLAFLRDKLGNSQ